MIFYPGCILALWLALQVSETFAAGGILPGLVHLSVTVSMWEGLLLFFKGDHHGR